MSLQPTSPSTDFASDNRDRPLPLRMRADLVVQSQRFRGRECVAVKDPLTGRYFRFESEEFFLLQSLDGRRSWREVQQRFEQQFAPQKVTLAELQRFVERVHRDSLVVSERTGQATPLLERHRNLRRIRRWQWLENILAIRLPLLNPDRILGALNRWFGSLFSRGAVIAVMLLCLSALILVGVEFEDFRRRLPAFRDFFTMQNGWLLAATLAVTKIVHELGHGLACKRFGRECRELGLMFLLGTPCLYCNVSDSWLLTSRWQRAAVAAAGMYVELLLAGLATWLWWFTAPGLLHFLCLDVMVVCSVSTLLFNGNPLLRCDGYFLLSDFVEIPNLRQRAGDALRRSLAGVLGLPAAEPAEAARGPWWLPWYAAASAVYRVAVAISAVSILLAALTPLGLRPLGQIIAALVGLSLLRPTATSMRRLCFGVFSRTSRMRPLRLRRLAICGTVVTALLIAACLLPLPRNIVCDCHVQARGATPIYVETPGALRAVHARPGQRVHAGQPLATLENLDSRLLVEQLAAQRSELAARLENLRRRGLRGETATLADLEPTRQALAALDERLALHTEQLRKLKIAAPTAGIVLAAIDDCRPHALDATNRGAWLADGQPLCTIADPASLDAVIEVPTTAAEFVHAGQRAEFLFASSPRRIESRVSDISQSPASAAEQLPSPAPAFLARCSLPTNSAPPLLGSPGRVKIHAGHATLLQRTWRWFSRTFVG